MRCSWIDFVAILHPQEEEEPLTRKRGALSLRDHSGLSDEEERMIQFSGEVSRSGFGAVVLSDDFYDGAQKSLDMKRGNLSMSIDLDVEMQPEIELDTSNHLQREEREEKEEEEGSQEEPMTLSMDFVHEGDVHVGEKKSEDELRSFFDPTRSEEEGEQEKERVEEGVGWGERDSEEKEEQEEEEEPKLEKEMLNELGYVLEESDEFHEDEIAELRQKQLERERENEKRKEQERRKTPQKKRKMTEEEKLEYSWNDRFQYLSSSLKSLIQDRYPSKEMAKERNSSSSFSSGPRCIGQYPSVLFSLFDSDLSLIFKELANLSLDFQTMVRRYAEIILSEHTCVALRDRPSIPFMNFSDPLGKGVLSGAKHEKMGIIFKFAKVLKTSSGQIILTEQEAEKVQGRGLNAQTWLFETLPSPLSVPLTAMMDFRGYRIVAEAKLPISQMDTLKYGCQNAGAAPRFREVQFDQEIHQMLGTVSRKLNLREHSVKCKVGSLRLFTPIDLEVHKSLFDSDPNLYCVDPSRLCPPECLPKMETTPSLSSSWSPPHSGFSSSLSPPLNFYDSDPMLQFAKRISSASASSVYSSSSSSSSSSSVSSNFSPPSTPPLNTTLSSPNTSSPPNFLSMSLNIPSNSHTRFDPFSSIPSPTPIPSSSSTTPSSTFSAPSPAIVSSSTLNQKVSASSPELSTKTNSSLGSGSFLLLQYSDCGLRCKNEPARSNRTSVLSHHRSKPDTRMVRCDTLDITVCSSARLRNKKIGYVGPRPGQKFYRLLRPELLLVSKYPLCSDALTHFVTEEEAKQSKMEVEGATGLLIQSVIPRFSHSLDHLPFKEDYPLCFSLRFHGINMRYLGVVWSLLTSPQWKTLLLLEMVARAVKHILRTKLRQIPSSSSTIFSSFPHPSESLSRSMIIEVLNKVFESSHESLSFWSKEIRETIREKFGVDAIGYYEEKERDIGERGKKGEKLIMSDNHCETKAKKRKVGEKGESEEMNEEKKGICKEEIEKNIERGLCLLLKNLQKMIWVFWPAYRWDELIHEPESFKVKSPFNLHEMVDSFPRIKEMGIMYYSAGVTLVCEALQGLKIKKPLLYKAVERFQLGLEGNARNVSTLLQISYCLFYLKQYTNALDYLSYGLSADPTNVEMLVLKGVMLMKHPKESDTDGLVCLDDAEKLSMAGIQRERLFNTEKRKERKEGSEIDPVCPWLALLGQSLMWCGRCRMGFHSLRSTKDCFGRAEEDYFLYLDFFLQICGPFPFMKVEEEEVSGKRFGKILNICYFWAAVAYNNLASWLLVLNSQDEANRSRQKKRNQDESWKDGGVREATEYFNRAHYFLTLCKQSVIPLRYSQSILRNVRVARDYLKSYSS